MGMVGGVSFGGWSENKDSCTKSMCGITFSGIGRCGGAERSGHQTILMQLFPRSFFTIVISELATVREQFMIYFTIIPCKQLKFSYNYLIVENE